MRTAAHTSEKAAWRVMEEYRDGLMTDEDDLTDVLLGKLDSDFRRKAKVTLGDFNGPTRYCVV